MDRFPSLRLIPRWWHHPGLPPRCVMPLSHLMSPVIFVLAKKSNCVMPLGTGPMGPWDLHMCVFCPREPTENHGKPWKTQVGHVLGSVSPKTVILIYFCIDEKKRQTWKWLVACLVPNLCFIPTSHGRQMWVAGLSFFTHLDQPILSNLRVMVWLIRCFGMIFFSWPWILQVGQKCESHGEYH